MKKHLYWILALILLLTACAPNTVIQELLDGEKAVEESEENASGYNEEEIPSISENQDFSIEESSEAPTPNPEIPIREKAESLIPYFSNKFFLTQLDDEDLANFCALYEAVKNFEPLCEYPYPTTQEKNERLAEFIVYECPEMMQYNREGSYTYYSGADGYITSRTIPYRMEEEEYWEKRNAVADVLKSIEAEMEGFSPYERELYIYRYIVDHNRYERDGENVENAYGLLIEGYAKCDGIAQTFKWLMDRAGVPNYILTGDLPDESDGHAWNVVQIDGQFYDLDITHDDLDAEEYEHAYIYGLVNVDRYLIRSQYTLRQPYRIFDLPGAEDMSGCYHAKNGTYIEEGMSTSDMFNNLMLDAWNRGGGDFSFQFADADQFQVFLDNAQSYINDAANYWQFSFNMNWYYMEESRAIWCYVTFV